MFELVRSQKFWSNLSKPFKFFIVIVLILGIFYGMNYYPIVRIVNQSERPLLMSDRNTTIILSMSHYLDPKVKLQLLSTSKLSTLTNNFSNFSDIFLFQPSERLKQTIQEHLNYQIVPVKKVRGLSKLEKLI